MNQLREGTLTFDLQRSKASGGFDLAATCYMILPCITTAYSTYRCKSQYVWNRPAWSRSVLSVFLAHFSVFVFMKQKTCMCRRYEPTIHDWQDLSLRH